MISHNQKLDKDKITYGDNFVKIICSVQQEKKLKNELLNFYLYYKEIIQHCCHSNTSWALYLNLYKASELYQAAFKKA